MRLFVKAVLAEQPWQYDSKVVPMPWRQAEADAIKSKIDSGGLTLGFYNCDGVVSFLNSARTKSHTDQNRSFLILPSSEVSRQS
jgi:amidase